MNYRQGFQFQQGGFQPRTQDGQWHTQMPDQSGFNQSLHLGGQSTVLQSRHQIGPKNAGIPGKQNENDLKKAKFEEQQRKLKEISSKGFKTKPREGKSLLDEFLTKTDVNLSTSFKQNQASQISISQNDGVRSQNHSEFDQSSQGYWPSSSIPSNTKNQGILSMQVGHPQSLHQFEAPTSNVAPDQNFKDKFSVFQQMQISNTMNSASSRRDVTEFDNDFGDFQGPESQKVIGLGSFSVNPGFEERPENTMGITQNKSEIHNASKPENSSFQQSHVTFVATDHSQSMMGFNSDNAKNTDHSTMIENEKEDPNSPERLYGSKLPKWCFETQLLPAIYKKILERSMSLDGSIDTNKLYTILMASNISKEKLRDIWEMANRKNPGYLVEEELYVVLGLIALAQAGWSKLSIAKLVSCVTAPIPEFPEYLFIDSEKESVFGGEAISTDDFSSTRSDSPIDPDDKYSIFKSFDRARSASVTSVERQLSNSSNDSSLYMGTKMQSILEKSKGNEQTTVQNLNTIESTSEWGTLKSSIQNEAAVPNSTYNLDRESNSHLFASERMFADINAIPASSNTLYPNKNPLAVCTETVTTLPAANEIVKATVTKNEAEVFDAFTGWSKVGQSTASNNTKSHDFSSGAFSTTTTDTFQNKQVPTDQFPSFSSNNSVGPVLNAQQIASNMQMDDFGDFQSIDNTKIDPPGTHLHAFVDTKTEKFSSNNFLFDHSIDRAKEDGTTEAKRSMNLSGTISTQLQPKDNLQSTMLNDSWDEFTVYTSSSNQATNQEDHTVSNESIFSNFTTSTIFDTKPDVTQSVIASGDLKNMQEMSKNNHNLFEKTATTSMSSKVIHKDPIKFPQKDFDLSMLSSVNTALPKSMSEPNIGSLPEPKREDQFSVFASFDSSSIKEIAEPPNQNNKELHGFDIFSSFNKRGIDQTPSTNNEIVTENAAGSRTSKFADFGNFEFSEPKNLTDLSDLVSKPVASQNDGRMNSDVLYQPNDIKTTCKIEDRGHVDKETTKSIEHKPKDFIIEPALEAEDRYKAITGVLEDSDIHVCEWKKCLASVKKVFETTATVMKSHNLSLQSKGEVFESEKGKDFFNDLKAIFAVVCRLKMSIDNSAFAKANEDLKSLLQNIYTLWREICNFSSGLPQHSLPGSLEDLKTKNTEQSSSNACGLCLLNVDTMPTEINRCIISTAKLTYGGKAYHSTCANFWCNKVNPVLPALPPLAFGLL